MKNISDTINFTIYHVLWCEIENTVTINRYETKKVNTVTFDMLTSINRCVNRITNIIHVIMGSVNE